MTPQLTRWPPIAFGAALALGALVLVDGCRRAPAPAAGATTTTEVPVARAPDEQVKSLSDMATDYETLQRRADDANRQVVTALSQYQKRGGKLPPSFGPDLTDEQRALLVERIQSERGGTKALLQEILDKNKTIQTYRAQLQSARAKLPDHVTAKEGDRHDRIAMNYLISKGVATDKAFQIVSQLNLQDALVPGFTVWTYYANGQFGTWVTRGSANVTPAEHQQQLTKLLAEERDTAKRQATELRGQVEEARGQLADARGQTKSANEESKALMDMLAEERAKAGSAMNTVRYSIGSKKQLVGMKVINNGMKLVSLDAADVFSVNVAESPFIAIEAGNFDLKTIKRLTIVPEIFIKGTDYELQSDGAFAKIKLVNLDKFKRNQFVIVLE